MGVSYERGTPVHCRAFRRRPSAAPASTRALRQRGGRINKESLLLSLATLPSTGPSRSRTVLAQGAQDVCFMKALHYDVCLMKTRSKPRRCATLSPSAPPTSSRAFHGHEGRIKKESLVLQEVEPSSQHLNFTKRLLLLTTSSAAPTSSRALQ